MRALGEFLSRPRSQYRVLATALGIAFVGIGLLFGFDKQFQNWGVVGFLVFLGVLLAVCGVIVPERYLVAAFLICVALNVLAAAYQLLIPPPGR